ncbi:hypothetical protein AcW1_007207 [Taiwanofungus camphoratus]|nr:hypothetical protein AcW2_007723 [Antrodia cinnamomea]KAI0952829.1 hypothetical protein AcW1_007207 [Antrodia cinnamomea]
MLALYILCSCAFLRVLYILLYRLFRSPLASLPGPWYTSLSQLPLMYYEFTRRRRRWVHSLHLQYGPVVRVAPDEVSFATWDAVKEIYVDAGGYDKTSFYHLFDNYNTPCMFSTLDRIPHREIKKRIADRYSKTHIMQPDVVLGIQERAEEFVARCTEKPGAAADIYLHLHCYALDCVTHHLFDPYGLHSLTEPSDLALVKALSYHDNLRASYMQYYFPQLYRLSSRLSHRKDRTLGLASRVLDLMRRHDSASHTTLHKLQAQPAPLPALAIASEMMDHAVAGIDTTGDALCLLLYHLSLPTAAAVRAQAQLHRELAAHPHAPPDGLPFLDAVVTEGLRCFGPIPMGLPRRVPRGGRVVAGARVPAGTVVGCQAYTLHRLDAAVFPDADAFVPERWLAPAGAAARSRLFFAFGAGARGCIGKHLALLEMKLLLREVYSTYRTRVAPEMTASMEQDDQVISSRPAGQTCLLVFEKIA